MIQEVEDINEALEVVDERRNDETVSIRGGMASIDDGHEVQAHHEWEPPGEDANPLAKAAVESVGNPIPEYIPSVEEVLEHGTEKGADADWTRVAGYKGERKQNLGLNHVWDALKGVQYHLKNWEIPEEERAQIRPVVMKYNDEVLGEFHGYRAKLPDDSEERSDAIDYVLVIDQDPSSEDYDIGSL